MNSALLETATIMMEDEVVLVCDMNNLGVKHLASGHYESAVALFTKAIRAAKALVDSDEESDGDNWDASEPSCPEIESSSSDLLFHTSVINEHAVNNMYAAIPSTAYGAFVYHRAFQLHHVDTVPPLEIICIVLLYNMGVGLHIQDIVSCSQQRLSRAITCYNLAASAACAAASDKTRRKSSTPLVFILAMILNNLGEAYFRVSHYDAMVTVYGHLEKCWARVALGEQPFLNEVEKCGLLWNMAFLKRPDTAAAA